MTFIGFPTIATVATPGGKVEIVIEVQRIDCGEPTPFECPIPLRRQESDGYWPRRKGEVLTRTSSLLSRKKKGRCTTNEK